MTLVNSTEGKWQFKKENNTQASKCWNQRMWLRLFFCSGWQRSSGRRRADRSSPSQILFTKQDTAGSEQAAS